MSKYKRSTANDGRSISSARRYAGVESPQTTKTFPTSSGIPDSDIVCPVCKTHQKRSKADQTKPAYHRVGKTRRESWPCPGGVSDVMNPDTKQRVYAAARSAAMIKLSHRHPEEYDMLLEGELRARGLLD